MPLPSRTRLPMNPSLPRPRHRWVPLVLILLAVLTVGCAAKRIVLADQKHPERSVTLIDGVDPAQPPADARFAAFSPLEAEASLRRIVVRPAHIISINRGDPQPLLVGEQLDWARDVLAAHLPTLKPNQRLELHFLDRFNDLDVTVQVYGIGGDLAYRFLKLASQPPAPDIPSQKKGPDFAAIEPQTGQQVADERDRVVLLRDPVFAGSSTAEAYAQVLSEVQRRVDAKRLSKEDVGPIEARLLQQRDLPLDAVRLYLDKLETINRALDQNLFSPQEAAARKQALLDALPPAK